MVTASVVIVGLVMTLFLPIYPEGLSVVIAAFLALTVVGGVLGLLDRSARRELVVMSPWAFVIMVAILVGSIRHGETRQAIEDTLPYALFILGLVAGRGARASRSILWVALAVCVGDAVVSMYLMPSFSAEMRSTYNYFKITAGLPIVGLYLVAMLRSTDTTTASARLLHRFVYAGSAVILLVGMVLSVSRGMMLGFLLGITIAAYVRKPSHTLLLAIAVILGWVVWASTFAEFGARYLRMGQASTIHGRFREIEAAWLAFTEYPLFGAGLGAMFEVDGFRKAFVHNMAAYHLWKFGLIGSGLLTYPLVVIARQLRRSDTRLRAIAIGGALGVIAYLVTCAAYKTYYLVWIYGIVAGASLSWLAAYRSQTASPRSRVDEPSLPGAASSR